MPQEPVPEPVVVKLATCKCKRCGRSWHPHVSPVRRCRHCKSLLWNVDPTSMQGTRPGLGRRREMPEEPYVCTIGDPPELRQKPKPTDTRPLRRTKEKKR